MYTPFPEIKKNFGFGCMRLPKIDDKIDNTEMCKMVDSFLEKGFNYFDTAHGYIDGKSEIALRECLTSRHPRESYILANKLTGIFFQKQEDIRPVFQQQLDACGVDYFDFYLMHCQTSKNYDKFQECRAYETAMELKTEGKIRHLGFSFHDSPEFLERILTDHPEVEFVQLQFNYRDWENPKVESRRCYEICRKHGKPVIVMEPVRGGKLINLPVEAQKVFDQLEGGSNASYAIRFAAGFEGIFMVLSGMGSMDMMNDNTAYMADFQPLSQQEMAAVEKVREILIANEKIDCTACRYCCDVCPQNIPIPELFADVNENRPFRDPDGVKKAASCIECGACEDACPQHLPIKKLVARIGLIYP